MPRWDDFLELLKKTQGKNWILQSLNLTERTVPCIGSERMDEIELPHSVQNWKLSLKTYRLYASNKKVLVVLFNKGSHGSVCSGRYL